MKVKIHNYRNISFEQPLEIEIKDGITFILGPNNVGKSNLINFFYDFRPIFIDNDFYKRHATAYKIKLDNKYFDQLINRNSNRREILLEITNSENITARYMIKSSKPETNHTSDIEVTITIRNATVNTTELKVYLETVHQFFAKTFIIGVYRTPLLIATGDSLDLNIGGTFISTWSDWADGGEVDKMKKIAELKIELRNLFNYTNFQIRVDKNRNSLLITTDDGEFYLSELGSGIGQFILILAKAVMMKPSYILIDEPEISLHPKMQEMFIRALAAKSQKGVFATSHSIGLARSVADDIYSLTKNDSGISNLSIYGQHYEPSISQSISEMSYSQYVEIGGNNILLVEGRTDIKAFREILRKYGIDNNFIIMSFGGRQFITKDKTKIIDELSEIKRFNAKSINVIFDSEITIDGESLRKEFLVFKQACEELGFNVFPTDRHSTENYISQAALNKIMGTGYQELGKYENFKNSQNQWPKEKNWLMFHEMNKSDFKDTALNYFIEKYLLL